MKEFKHKNTTTIMLKKFLVPNGTNKQFFGVAFGLFW